MFACVACGRDPSGGFVAIGDAQRYPVFGGPDGGSLVSGFGENGSNGGMAGGRPCFAFHEYCEGCQRLCFPIEVR